MKKILLFSAALITIYSSVSAQSTLYVDSSAVSGTNTGSNWTDAYTKLSDAISFAMSPAGANVNSILVAKGTYFPTGTQNGANRDSAFLINRGGLKIYGGYASGGTSRDVNNYPAILSGDIGNLNNNADNSFHLMIVGNQSANTDSIVIDGFTLTNGNANGNTYNSLSYTYGENSGSGISLFDDGSHNNMAFRNLTLIDNTASNVGAAMLINSANPFLDHCYFLNNNTPNNGGGIYSSNNSSTTITNSLFANNQAVYGSAFTNDNSNATIINTIFDGNTGVSGQAGFGAIYNYYAHNFSIINSTFFNNYSSEVGAIYNNNINAGTIENTVFWDNTNSGGSNDFNTTNNLIIKNTYSQNDYSALSNTNIIATANPFMNSGNPIGPDNIWGTNDDGLNLNGCSPLLNTGDNAFATNISTDITGNLRIYNNTVDLGAYEYQNNPSAVTTIYVDSAAIGNNNGSSWADAYVHLSDAIAEAQGCSKIDTILIAKGTYYPTGAQTGTNRDSTFLITRGGLKIYGGYANGGALHDINTYPTVLSGNIGNTNNATDNIYHVMVIAGVASGEDSIVLDGIKIANGNANYTDPDYSHTYGDQYFDASEGGGLVLLTNAATAPICLKHVTISGNNGYFYGGGISNSRSVLLMDSCSVTGNTTKSDAGQGGGGAGIDAFGGDDNSSIVVITNSVFSNNVSGAFGGGIYMEDVDSALIRNTSFTTNQASDGGGLYTESSIKVSNCSFLTNTVNRDNGGGGAYNLNCNPVYDYCIFTGNIAKSGAGAGMCNDNASAKVLNSQFTFNRYTSNNGVTGGGAIGNLGGSPEFIHCTISRNYSSGAGGEGMYNSASNPLIIFCDFISDTATYYGGAIANSYNNGSSPVISHCNFIQNVITQTNAKGGAGIDNYNVSPQITNSLFYNNTAKASGGAINNENASSTITNCTIYGNTGSKSGGIYNNSNGSATVYNSIVFGNNTTGFANDASSSIVIRNSLVQDNNTDTSGNIIGTTNPMFADPSTGNFQLLATSPAINFGTNDFLANEDTLDLTGNTRIHNNTVDMGAYEYQGSPIATPVTIYNFSGELKNNTAILQWQTGVEINVNRFEIEKSTNGKTYNPIGSVQPKGSNNSYIFNITQVEPTAYYRLKSIDNDGSFAYAKNIIFLSQDTDNNISLYPNPATDHINIKIAANGTITIYNSAGRLVKSQALQEGVNTINIKDLTTGVYFGIINGQKIRFIKK